MPKALAYRAIGESGEYPDFIRSIDGRSGSYVIRDKKNRQILYVGESHTGRLKKTLLRHFQRWKGKTAGNTYKRHLVEVAIRLTPPTTALSAQNNLIKRLKPRDNEIGQPISSDDNPF